MKSGLGRARVPLLAVGAVCVLAVGAGWGIAASTTSTSTIRACASKSTGVLRLATATLPLVPWTSANRRASASGPGSPASSAAAKALDAISPLPPRTASPGASAQPAPALAVLSKCPPWRKINPAMTLMGAESFARCSGNEARDEGQ
jgi:hypothetical protein